LTSQIPHITAEKADSVLEHHGFVMVAQRGSHQKWRLEGAPGIWKQVIVPYHQGRDLPTGTMKAIIDGSGLGVGEFGE
jgi:predicted RNA binding protein YcfA (HicA-like mRNA interferase family)